MLLLGRQESQTYWREWERWREMTTFEKATKTEAEQIGGVQTYSLHFRGYKTDVAPILHTFSVLQWGKSNQTFKAEGKGPGADMSLLNFDLRKSRHIEVKGDQKHWSECQGREIWGEGDRVSEWTKLSVWSSDKLLLRKLDTGRPWPDALWHWGNRLRKAWRSGSPRILKGWSGCSDELQFS